MSKAVKTVVGVVVAIAIPFAAPMIAGAIGASLGISAATFGMSATVGSVLGSAAVGAALGGASQAVLGGDVKRGALMGAIGGGIGGYTSATAAAAAPPTGGAAPGVAPGGTPTAGLAGMPQTTVNEFGQIVAAPTAAAATTAAPTGFGGLAQTTVDEFGQIVAAPTVPQTGLAGATQTTVNEFGQIVPSSPAAVAPPATAGLQGVPQAAQMGPQTAPQMKASFEQQMSNAGVVSRPATFMDALAKVPGEIAAKFSDPKALADMTLRAAGSLAGSAVAGDGLSNEERALLDAQAQELRTLQQTNAGLFAQRLEQAQNLIGESKYFDPEYFGLQRARRAQTAGAKAKRAGLRGLEGAGRAAESRRFDLATARDVGTSYDQGYLSGAGGRLQTMQAGMQMMPTGFPSSQSEYGNLRRAYSDAETRAGTRAKNFGEMFGSITGIPQAQSRG